MEHLCHDPPAEESVVGAQYPVCHDAAEYRVVVIRDSGFPVFVGGDQPARRPRLHGGTGSSTSTPPAPRVPRYAPARPFGKSGGRIMAGHLWQIDGAVRILADNGARGGKFALIDGEFVPSGLGLCSCSLSARTVNLLIVDCPGFHPFLELHQVLVFSLCQNHCLALVSSSCEPAYNPARDMYRIPAQCATIRCCPYSVCPRPRDLSGNAMKYQRDLPQLRSNGIECLW